MNSLEILKSLAAIRFHTVGVFPADQIPRVWTKPTAFVFNIDGHKKPGSHWVCVYVNKSDIGWYFDSFGLPPIKPEFINRLRKNCKRFHWNTVQLQSETSNACGQFCIMFLFCMSAGLSMKQFLKKFYADPEQNEAIVKKFIKRNLSSGKFRGYGKCFVRCSQNSCAKMSLLQ